MICYILWLCTIQVVNKSKKTKFGLCQGPHFVFHTGASNLRYGPGSQVLWVSNSTN
jgi:hypothetical protein